MRESPLESPRARPFRFGTQFAFAFPAHNAENGSMLAAQGHRRTATQGNREQIFRKVLISCQEKVVRNR